MRIRVVLHIMLWMFALVGCVGFERPLSSTERRDLIQLHRLTPLLIGEYAQSTVILYEKNGATGCMSSDKNDVLQTGGGSTNRMSTLTVGTYPRLDPRLIVLHIPVVNAEYLCVRILDPVLAQKITTMEFYSFDGSVSKIAITNGMAVFGRYMREDAEDRYRAVVFYDANHTVVAASESGPP